MSIVSFSGTSEPVRVSVGDVGERITGTAGRSPDGRSPADEA